MSKLQFQLFGKFTAHLDNHALKGLEASKDQELLSYLLIHCNRHHSREALAALLWGDSSTDKSKKYLRQAVWHLHAMLDSNRSDSSPVLLVEHDWLRLNPDGDLWSDVSEFERAFAGAEGMIGARLHSSTAQALKHAVGIYQGDLLAGWYQDWILFERERFQNMYLLMLDKLIGYAEQHHQYDVAYGYGAMILRYDPARERTHRQLMRLHYLAGDRTSALRQYERCVSALEEELGVSPERRTVTLYERIRYDQFSPNELTETELLPSRKPVSSDIVGRLKQLQTILSAVQRRIQRDIKAVEGVRQPEKDKL
jgi:DNA-binding SARP family transcriptional activator